jgi:hypothetical protein
MATEYGGSTSTASSGTVGALSRQPTVFDYAQSNQFKLYLPLFPTMEWFVVRAAVPGMNLGQATQVTPFVDMPLVGDKIVYDAFNLTFLVDEKYHNYMEIYNWVKNIGFPFEREGQFNKLPRADGIDRSGHKQMHPVTGKIVDSSDRNLYTDIELTILTSKNNPIVRITMYEAFPTNLGALEYSQQESDTDYVRCDVTFAYSWFDVNSL